jgi:membrane-associated phospholipid phosphatase
VLLQAAGALALALTLVERQPAAPAASWPDDKPFTHFAQNLGRDLVAVASPTPLLILGAAGAGAWAASPADDNLSDWAEAQGDSGYSRPGDVLGQGWVQGAGAIATYVTGRLLDQPRVTHTGSDLVRAQALNAVLTWTLKLAVDRTRPSGGSHAFPSGHASATFASAAVLHVHFGWKTGLPAYAVASFVGWTRIRDREHWLSDVVFGAGVGLAAGYAVTRGHRARDWQVVPVPLRRGAAVFIIRSR